MKLFKQSIDIQLYLTRQKKHGLKLGFVPTMGALHDGHISLLQMGKESCDSMVCSIFVNPTQFNDQKDFKNYPSTISQDILLLEKAGCDVLFLPQANEIYPQGTDHLPHYNLGEIEQVLEGEFRPGHYQGVCQVVHRLLDIVSPKYLFLGQKDYQQCMVLKRLVELIKSPTEIIIGRTYREPSGLAMSSRNQRLTDEQKNQATAIFKMLIYLKENYKSAPWDELIDYATSYLLSSGFQKVDYITIRDAATLEMVDQSESQQLVALVAAFIDGVRLIDNMLLSAS